MPREQELISQWYLKLGGVDASEEMMNNIISVEVDDNLLLPDMFIIHLRDPKLEWVDSDTLALGKAVEISVRGENGSIKLMAGEITAIELELSRSMGPTLLARGYDRSHRLNREKLTRSFVQVTDSDIATSIARESSLRANVDPTREVHEYVLQDNKTNWEFLWERARRIGYHVFVEDDALHFREVPEEGAQVPVLEWGVNLPEFNARLNTAQQVGEVIVRGWDPVNKEEIVGRATAPQDTPEVGERRQGGQAAEDAFHIASKEVIVNRPIATQAEADDLAQSICDEIGGDFIQAEGTCFGNPDVQAGVKVEFRGLGDKFGGRYRVSHVLHRYDAQGYTTQFTIGGRHANTLGELLASTKAESHSPMVGIVTNNEDPNGLGRVKVKLPSRGNKELGWARLVAPGLGKNKGLWWLPDVGDEVLVVFEHEDIHRPFVLGGLWNLKDLPTLSPTNFIDKGKATRIGLESAGKNYLVIFDQVNNSVVHIGNAKAEITLDQTRKELRIGSEGDVKITGRGKITVEGAQIEIKSSGNMKIEGGGIVEIKGAQVKIN
jgi:phage protein D/phage baseplate assembly protein gpV